MAEAYSYGSRSRPTVYHRPASVLQQHSHSLPVKKVYIQRSTTTTEEPYFNFYTTEASDYYAETIEYPSDYYETTPYSYVDPGTYFIMSTVPPPDYSYADTATVTYYEDAIPADSYDATDIPSDYYTEASIPYNPQ